MRRKSVTGIALPPNQALAGHIEGARSTSAQSQNPLRVRLYPTRPGHGKPVESHLGLVWQVRGASQMGYTASRCGLLEAKGLEPSTFALRTRRSPKLSYAP